MAEEKTQQAGSERSRKISALFVCTGNVCRSPMAEGFLRKMVEDDGADLVVLSAGTFASSGQSPSTNAVLAMRELGIDISTQSSSPLDRDLFDDVDYIICMTRSHMMQIEAFFTAGSKAAKDFSKKIYLISEFIPEDNLRGAEVPDPIGGDLETYRRTRDFIRRAVECVFQYLRQTNAC